MGDFNWDQPTGMSGCFKELCDSLNIMQHINALTRFDPEAKDISTLLDLILNKYTT